MPHVNYVELSVPDLNSAAEFYRSVFSWDPQQFADEYLVVAHGDEPGVDVGIQPAQAAGPTAIPVITVDSIDETLEKVTRSGGTVVVDKFPIPDVGHAAYFVDPAGLQIGLHQAPAT